MDKFIAIHFFFWFSFFFFHFSFLDRLVQIPLFFSLLLVQIGKYHQQIDSAFSFFFSLWKSKTLMLLYVRFKNASILLERWRNCELHICGSPKQMVSDNPTHSILHIFYISVCATKFVSPILVSIGNEWFFLSHQLNKIICGRRQKTWYWRFYAELWQNHGNTSQCFCNFI